MKKFSFGTPEKFVPSYFCRGFHYEETPVSFTAERFSCRDIGKGFIIEYETEPGTEIFGFGLQLKHFRHTGTKLTIRNNADPQTPTGDSHAPVPFFVTNKGYGIFVDTARYAEFYSGRKKKSSKAESAAYETTLSTDELYSAKQPLETTYMSIYIPVAKGVDLYVIEGESIGDIVAQYNMLSGGGCAVPDWGLGILYRCCGRYDRYQIREIIDYFKEKKMPCDTFGLEPGWQTRAYSCSYMWNPQRFPDHEEFVKGVIGDGYHLNLWQHGFVHPDSPIHDALLPYSGDYRVWDGVVPDFSLPEARKIYSEHFRDIAVSLGIDGFKIDECDGSDNTDGWSFPNHAEFPSGMDGEVYHNLFGVLYAQTILETLEGRPTLSEVRSMGALAASYPFVLYSDLYDHRDFVRGMVNAGLSGLLWAPEVRGCRSRKDMLRRMQTVVFSVHCLVNAWNYEGIPWVIYDCEEEIRALLELRRSLVPMLSKAFAKYHETGVPPIRALLMDYSDDPETYGIDDEYLFCEDLLVAPVIGDGSDTREVYLPKGKWVDFFTGEEVSAGRFTVTTEGIPVYRRVSEPVSEPRDGIMDRGS